MYTSSKNKKYGNEACRSYLSIDKIKHDFSLMDRASIIHVQCTLVSHKSASSVNQKSVQEYFTLSGVIPTLELLTPINTTRSIVSPDRQGLLIKESIIKSNTCSHIFF